MMKHFKFYALGKEKQENIIGGIAPQFMEENVKTSTINDVVDYIYAELTPVEEEGVRTASTKGKGGRGKKK